VKEVVGGVVGFEGVGIGGEEAEGEGVGWGGQEGEGGGGEWGGEGGGGSKELPGKRT